MRQLSTNIASLLDLQEEVETLFLVRITDKDGAVVFSSTSYYENVTLSNGYLYEANGMLVSADPPQLSTTVDREQYKITIADPEFMQGDNAENGLTGKRMEVRLGFVEPEIGVPYTDEIDTFIVYRGRVDGAAYKISTEEFGEALLQITGVSPIMSLEMKKGFRLTKDATRQRNPTDSSCDQLYEGSSTIVLKWGKS